MLPRFHATPDEAVADRVREKVTVEGRTFRLDRPAGLDKVLQGITSLEEVLAATHA